MEEIFEKENPIRVILVGVDTGEEYDFQRSMEELSNLAQACNKEVVEVITQKLENVNKGLYIGTGKVEELRRLTRALDVTEVIFDNALSPSQIRNLGRELEVVISDRTNLILDIFALRAKTKEAKLQVETAKLQYMLPRLVGLHESLGRQGGASGSMSNKGTGEKKLELDRRQIEKRISELRKELKEIEQNRATQRKRRSNSRIPQVALVGYTNAGKSTVMNHMVEKYGQQGDKKVLEQDMLFATLETSIRRIDFQDNQPFFLADTVGFVHKLPHDLVQAFHSTLEEVRFADLLVQVVDFSDDSYKQQMEVTLETLKQLDAAGIPQIIVYNKSDRCCEMQLPKVHDNQIYMAAALDLGIDELAELIKKTVYNKYVECQFRIPYDKGSISSYLMENATIHETKYEADGIYIWAQCSKQDALKYEEYCV